MRSMLFLLLTSTLVGTLLAQYPYQYGMSRQVTFPASYAMPSCQTPCQTPCQCCPTSRVSVVPYNYCPPHYLQQNIVPPPCPVYQPTPIYVPIPPPPKDCSCAHTTGHQQYPEPGHHPTTRPHPNHPSIPGLSDAESKKLLPHLANPGNHPCVVQSVIVGGKKDQENEKEKGEKDKGKECKKKKEWKKKCSEEVEDDDHEDCYRKRRHRRMRKNRRRSYSEYDPLEYEDYYDYVRRCSQCNGGGGADVIITSGDPLNRFL
ncbi:uncharacterized protein LOC128982164 isoform X1 [Macrosteles quadrilineatus]|uniref:uncharacterized protein LOC128982164 isoform X1 n=1 Tax=Macrosteles quadrilineatus TaxID=74068 RepID=UPI0023E2ACB6|nr:uncharacterized protein LOC128982164 isoform X1 [Macrosteles quadrilineatus]